ncbi:MAG: cbb3-type cytochrome c oxidase subunit 3 [Calditrichia bacterium]
MSELFSQKLFQAWAGFFLIMLIVVAGFVIWAIRSKQFKNQEHARHLPLESEIPEKDAGEKDV